MAFILLHLFRCEINKTENYECEFRQLATESNETQELIRYDF